MKSLLASLLLALFLVVPTTQAQTNTTFTRIQFQPGATGAQVNGQVSGAVSAGYVLGAAAGQTMTISLNTATLTVVSPSGVPLARGTATAEPIRYFSQVLPESGDYLVYVSLPAGSGVLNFTMNVSITGTPDRTGSAERISFQPGTTGAQVTGIVSGSQPNNYVLYASAGQVMMLTLDNGTLTVVSPSGQPLVRGTVVSTPVRYFSQVLPETGDYRVAVNTDNGTGAASYTLTVSITGNSSGVNAPQRVNFALGATNAQVTGQLNPGESDVYVLNAFAGQTMSVSAPNTSITLISPSGVMLNAPQPNGVTVTLPESGDSYVQLSNTGATAINYAAVIAITGTPDRTTTTERIRFQTGATGAQVFGQVSGAQTEDRYVLFAFAGQTMQVTLDNATLTVVSPSGQPLVRGTVTAAPVRSFSQVLPETGDYQVYVSVPAGSPVVNYTMTVIIP